MSLAYLGFRSSAFMQSGMILEVPEGPGRMDQFLALDGRDSGNGQLEGCSTGIGNII